MIVTVIKKNESVIYGGKIYTSGQSFEVDESIGKSLIERGFVALASPPSSPKTEENDGDSSDLHEKSYAELKKLAGQMGISANGKKDELIARIESAREEVEAEAGEEEDFSDDLPNTDMPE